MTKKNRSFPKGAVRFEAEALARFPLLFRGRPCRVYRETGPGAPVVQFEDGHVAVVDPKEIVR
jgi:hypothetical protein